MSRNYDYTQICQHCYLSHCVFESWRLGMYCPEYQARKRKIEPEIILAIVKTVGTNRRWDFIKGVQNATVDAE
jgi:hypothetical protein